ncbi:MAG: NAD-dependent epimerase/dehydratase family protein [Chlamydiales bacterium]|nr:NAD-dependent epimerase/dehydratase family protein [Chlamydiales bacterium]NCF70673.1 NAD-dependent epimerase/dehydratase family protein [Chlamydiales bacterium]
MTKTMILGIGYIGSKLFDYWDEEGSRTLVGTTTSAEKIRSAKQAKNVITLLNSNDKRALEKELVSTEELIIAIAPKKNASYKEAYLNTAKNLSSILATNNSLRHLVYLSSTSVYGDREGAWVTEESFLGEKSEKSSILSSTETVYLNLLSDQLRVSVLRLGGIYGPGRTHSSRLSYLAKKPLPVSQTSYSNWAHQEDIIRAIDWVLEKRLSGIYNICSDDHPTKKDFYEKIAKELGIDQLKWTENKVASHAGDKRVSNDKIKDSGFQFLHNCNGPLEWLYQSV